MVRPTEAQGRADGPHGTGASSPRCRFCAADAAPRPSSTSACRPCARRTSPPSSCTRWSRSIRCTLCVRPMLPGAAAGVRFAAEHLHRVRLLLVVFDAAGSSMRAAMPTWRSSRFGLGAAQQGDGDRQQRWLPAAALRCRAACPCSASSPRRTWPRWPSRRGIPTAVRFFGRERRSEIAREHGRPDLLLGNNVLAHVPDLNDFVAGMKMLLAPGGVITMEFPHLLRLMAENQFDTIYHEHFSYFSFLAVERVFAHHGLTLFDVEELPTHGGSLRIYRAPRRERRAAESGARVDALRRREIDDGFLTLERYRGFGEQVKATKRKLLELPDRRQAARQEDGRLRRARQGQHVAQLLRHPHRLPRFHRRRQSVQAGQVHARHAHSDPRRPRRSAKPGPTTS